MAKKANNPKNLKKTAGPGRPKGSKNKIPGDLKERVMRIVEELDAKGKGLTDCANQDPKWFFENFVKPLLPKNVEATVDLSENAMSVAVRVIQAMRSDDASG